MASPQTAEELGPILTELGRQTDRGMAIIASAMLDEMLSEALEARLILGSSSLQERLFSYEKNGPLATFSAKIDLAFATGLLKAEQKNDLHLVRRIRNKFAHRLQAIVFENTEISAYCNSFTTARTLKDWGKANGRQRFSAVYVVLLTALRMVRTEAVRMSLDPCHSQIESVLTYCIEALTSDEPATAQKIVEAHLRGRARG